MRVKPQKVTIFCFSYVGKAVLRFVHDVNGEIILKITRLQQKPVVKPVEKLYKQALSVSFGSFFWAKFRGLKDCIPGHKFRVDRML